MASNQDDQVPLEEEEDILAETNRDPEEEEDGDDLFDENMAADYQENPELDQYDPAMIDENEQEVLTVEQRLAAEREMAERDREQGRRRPLDDPLSPGGFASVAGGSDHGDGMDGGSSVGGSFREARPNKRQRLFESSEGDNQDGGEEDWPESYYDLSHEKLEEAITKNQPIEERLETKIKRCFRMFLVKFTLENADQPRYPDLLLKMAEENHHHLDVNFNHIHAWSAPLALWIAEHPQHVLPLLNQALLKEAAKRYGIYRQLVERDETELRVAIHRFPLHEPIRDLSTRHIGKMVCVDGVVTKRLKVNNEVKRLYLRCAKCNFLTPPYDVEIDKDLRPGSCIECQSRGPWKVDRQHTLYRNHQKLTIQESPNSVQPGKMPRSKEVILSGDQVDSARPGDSLRLTGIYRCRYDALTNARTCFPVFRTEIQAVHLNRRGDVKPVEMTDDKLSQIMDLAKDPNIRERFIASMAPSIYGMKHVKTAIAMSMMSGVPKNTAGKHRIRGDINTLIVGDPGLAKSQFLKYIEQTFPRAVYTTGKGASAVGLTAAVTRDENGDWALEGGAMVMADDGLCLIDEFDKMNDNDRTSLHEAMEQQTISVSKAGIVATLKAQCAVVAVANPTEGRYDPQRTFSQNVNLTDPILSRFDVLCVLRDESDPVQDMCLADHVVCSHIRSHPDASGGDKKLKPKMRQKVEHFEPIDQELLKFYIMYARNSVKPKLGDINLEKIANFYKDIRGESFRSGGQAMTARHIDSIVRLAEANARLELRQHVLEKDVDNAIQLMLESYIQSQKHQVAEELTKRFGRYVVKAATPADRLDAMIDKMFKAKYDRVKLARQGGALDMSEISIPVADLIRRIEQEDQPDLTVDEAANFMRSQRFRLLYQVEGEDIKRLA